MMAHSFLRLFALFALLGLVTAAAAAQDCSGTITADEAMKAETARYAAQPANDFAAMEKLFGNDLTYTTPPPRPTTRRSTSTACARDVRSTAR
jgi:hypothetical protein